MKKTTEHTYVASNSLTKPSIWIYLANFRGLVFDGIEAKFRNQMLVRKLLTRSIIFNHTSINIPLKLWNPKFKNTWINISKNSNG